MCVCAFLCGREEEGDFAQELLAVQLGPWHRLLPAPPGVLGVPDPQDEGGPGA